MAVNITKGNIGFIIFEKAKLFMYTAIYYNCSESYLNCTYLVYLYTSSIFVHINVPEGSTIKQELKKRGILNNKVWWRMR